MSNSLDQDQARRFVVGPDLGPNWLQRSAANDKNSPLAGKELTDKPGYSKFKNRKESNLKASFICTIYTPVQIYTRGVNLHLGCILVM